MNKNTVPYLDMLYQVEYIFIMVKHIHVFTFESNLDDALK